MSEILPTLNTLKHKRIIYDDNTISGRQNQNRFQNKRSTRTKKSGDNIIKRKKITVGLNGGAGNKQF